MERFNKLKHQQQLDSSIRVHSKDNLMKEKKIKKSRSQHTGKHIQPK